MGRPSLYTPELVEAIADRVAEGTPLAEICREDGMPAYRTVKDWIDANPDVSAVIARAREAGFDQIALDALKIADYGENDTKTDKDGNERVDTDVIARSKLRVETRLKLLAKWDPKRYGDRQILAGDPDAPLRGLTDEELDAKLAAKFAAAGISNG